MGVWEGVSMDSLQFHPGPPCFTLLRPAGGPPLKQPYGCFRRGLPAGRKACGHLLLLWTPYAGRLWKGFFSEGGSRIEAGESHGEADHVKK
jgi:hypothetical protein